MIVIGRTDMLEDDHRMKKEYENIDSLKALKAYGACQFPSAITKEVS